MGCFQAMKCEVGILDQMYVIIKKLCSSLLQWIYAIYKNFHYLGGVHTNTHTHAHACVCVCTEVTKILWMFWTKFHNTDIKELCTVSWSVICIHIAQYFCVTEVINYFIVEGTLRSLLNGRFCLKVNKMRRNIIFTNIWQQGERFLIFSL
jgi:hypothetical protein